MLSSAPFAPANVVAVSVLTKRIAHPTDDDGEATTTSMNPSMKEESTEDGILVNPVSNTQQIAPVQIRDDDRGKTVPFVSLKTFLRDSEKRRKLHLQQTVNSCYRQQSTAKVTSSSEY